MATKANNLRLTGYGGQEREILKEIWHYMKMYYCAPNICNGEGPPGREH